MATASVDYIKKELQTLPPKKILELTLRLARFKKENKELLSYLLFDSGDEAGYISSLQMEIDDMLNKVSKAPSATVKKQLRQITRLITRQSKYIGTKSAAAELHMHFCKGMVTHPENLLGINSANTIYHQQLHKINKLLPLLDDDLQHDFQVRLEEFEERRR